MTIYNQFICDIPYLGNSVDYFIRLKPLKNRVWLDSGRPSFKTGRYDILSAAPKALMFNPSTEEIEAAVASIKDTALIDTLSHHHIPFWGGAIGYFNYEYNAKCFGLPQPNEHGTPSVFGIFEWALIQDHESEKAHLVFLPSVDEKTRLRIKNVLCSPLYTHPNSFEVTELTPDLDKSDYRSAFAKIDDYIHAGDTYQINYSQRFSGKFSGEADEAYIALRKVLPSPFSAFIELGSETILSFSPERFIEISEGHAKTQPIKGTAARSDNPEFDHFLASELQKSEKNRAENLMIVDLLRNDFNQSCEPFSVKVPSLFELESFANVHHLVSTVVGEIQPNISPLTFFMRCFPGGSITGAPKKRAMEIIAELEDVPRNIYCGSICYLSTTGRFDSSITIRTLLVSDGKVFCWGGGGIVADSEAESEYQESIQKVKILIQALTA